MSGSSTTGLVAALVLIIVNAILSAAHSALVNARKQQLRELAEAGNRRAQRVLDISEDATRLLTSRQFVGIVLRFLEAGLLTVVIAEPLIPAVADLGVSPELARWSVYIAVWILGALVMMIFGELIPSAFAAARAERMAMFAVGPMTLVLNMLKPISRLMLWLSDRIAALFGEHENAPYVTEEEIKTLVDAGSEEGVIEDEEKEMIYSIFQFGDKVVREIMIPRIDIQALDADATVQEALDMIISEGHSRIPVYEGSVDRISGLLYAKDLLGVWHAGQERDRKVREIMRPAYFVPESKRAGSLLEELQQRKIHMAIVIDEYGGTAGLVTIEDLVEEIVGEIQDEYDPDEEAEFVKIGDDEYLFDASIDLDDVSELLDVHLSAEESDTLGGYVLGVLGRVPLAGETFQERGLEIKVEAITGRRIRKVRVRRLPPPSPPDTGSADHKADQKSDEPVHDSSRPSQQENA